MSGRHSRKKPTVMCLMVKNDVLDIVQYVAMFDVTMCDIRILDTTMFDVAMFDFIMFDVTMLM